MKKQSFIGAVSFIIGVSLILWLPCVAESKLTIQTARVDFVGGYLYVYGTELDGVVPNVSLGRFVLSVLSSTAGTIQTVLPPNIPDGEYLLTVSTGNGPNKNDSIPLIIGTFGGQGIGGPTGPAGPAGPAGATGAQGPAGAPGAQGPAGAPGAQGPPGAPGAQGPQGAQGLQGLKGDTGTTGPAGVSFDLSRLYTNRSAENPPLKSVFCDGDDVALGCSAICPTSTVMSTIYTAQFGGNANTIGEDVPYSANTPGMCVASCFDPVALTHVPPYMIFALCLPRS